MVDKYKEALHEAQAELAQIEERRTNLLKLIEALKVLAGDDTYELAPPPGYEPKQLTEEIRTVLSLTTVPLDAVQIRDALIQRGVKHSNPKNLLISVHTVLGRIKDELNEVERDGKSAYLPKVREKAPLAVIPVKGADGTIGMGGVSIDGIVGLGGIQNLVDSQKAMQKMVEDANATLKTALGSGIQAQVEALNKTMEEAREIAKLAINPLVNIVPSGLTKGVFVTNEKKTDKGKK